MGTFGRLVFCVVRTQIVGKTEFFDSLSRPGSGRLRFHLKNYRIYRAESDAAVSAIVPGRAL